jgi:hypothetical protein
LKDHVPKLNHYGIETCVLDFRISSAKMRVQSILLGS